MTECQHYTISASDCQGDQRMTFKPANQGSKGEPVNLYTVTSLYVIALQVHLKMP
jgi:hypothetical protein